MMQETQAPVRVLDDGYYLYGEPGSGSVVVEAALELAGLDYEVEYFPATTGAWSDEKTGLNPIRQVPVLRCPDGTIMTESGAMVVHIQDVAPACRLVPAREDPSRRSFWRWLFFINASVYPTFSYGDVPERFVEDPGCARQLRQTTDARRVRLWGLLEEACQDPFFLGEGMSAIDVYFWVMSHWRPGPEWFGEHCPKIAAIAGRVSRLEPLRAVQARNFPRDPD